MKPLNHILEARNLSIGYKARGRDKVVLSDINFGLNSGELVGLVGANGIGKSTLLKTLTKIEPALNGSVFIQNMEIRNLNPLDLAKIMSLVLTQQPISKNLSVFELIALGRQPYTNWIGKLSDIDNRRIKDALQLTGIEHLANRPCYELSDGQLQIVMIARALAQDTELIILDEPTTHLDLFHKAQILNLLKNLASKHNKTILFSSHEIDLCIQLCDRMLVMDDRQVYNNSPCKLISEGVFDTLFPDSLITFDQNSGSFKLRQSDNFGE